MLIVTHIFNGLFMVVLPIVVTVVLARRLKLAWWPLVGIGAATFILSQVVRLPLLQGMTLLLPSQWFDGWTPDALFWFNMSILSLTAGIFEEGARYLVYRFWIKKRRTFNEGVLFGAGHGGVEALILGGLVLLTFVNMMALREMDLTQLEAVIPPAQLSVVLAQLEAYWSAEWYEPLLGSLERVLAMTLHITLAVMVLQVFVRRNICWLVAAILFHAFFNLAAVVTNQYVGAVAAEAVLVVLTIGAVWLLFWMRRTHPEAEPEPETTPAPESLDE